MGLFFKTVRSLQELVAVQIVELFRRQTLIDEQHGFIDRQSDGLTDYLLSDTPMVLTIDASINISLVLVVSSCQKSSCWSVGWSVLRIFFLGGAGVGGWAGVLSFPCPGACFRVSNCYLCRFSLTQEERARLDVVLDGRGTGTLSST